SRVFAERLRLPDQPHLREHAAARFGQGHQRAVRNRPMGFKDISQIAGSAMAAQSVRLNTIASNLANADAAAGSEGEAYRARKPVFATMM
nr:hypothetical protein [Tanacetum cinerariifolium]